MFDLSTRYGDLNSAELNDHVIDIDRCDNKDKYLKRTEFW